jgi:hypothetical protein
MIFFWMCRHTKLLFFNGLKKKAEFFRQICSKTQCQIFRLIWDIDFQTFTEMHYIHALHKKISNIKRFYEIFENVCSTTVRWLFQNKYPGYEALWLNNNNNLWALGKNKGKNWTQLGYWSRQLPNFFFYIMIIFYFIRSTYISI